MIRKAGPLGILIVASMLVLPILLFMSSAGLGLMDINAKGILGFELGDRQPMQPEPVRGSPTATPYWHDFYGLNSTCFGKPLSVGTVVRAFDPDGVLCGQFEVTTVGWYGVMPVYGDDPGTGIDEGCEVGDVVEFRVDGAVATTNSTSTWALKSLQQVELSVEYVGLSKADIDAIHGKRHDALSEAYHAQKDGSGVTAKEKALYQRAHAYIHYWHERTLIEYGYIEDILVDPVYGSGGEITGFASGKTRGDQLDEKISAEEPTVAEITAVSSKWGLDIGDLRDTVSTVVGP